jgi:transcriptional regulator with XRE-family HTH domain
MLDIGNERHFHLVTTDVIHRKDGSVSFRVSDSTDRVSSDRSHRIDARKTARRGPVILVRQEIGDVLRDFRLQKGRTLRQVASKASVALGYLSEVERGQKEASSEILASVAEALDTPISVIMREVGDRLAVIEGIDTIPDTVPDEFVAGYDSKLLAR